MHTVASEKGTRNRKEQAALGDLNEQRAQSLFAKLLTHRLYGSNDSICTIILLVVEVLALTNATREGGVSGGGV